ncbi:zinc-ribbon domain-containing protein [Pedobacter punctiformis]|uniref:zinc-ribbon domain-containing protein n=1 Tax=Pedobacter punctiformis TaxID=3004097 RepID=UPI003D1816FF
MIFFFGTRSSTVLTEKLNYCTCAHCQQQDTIYITAISSYFHVFWIPVFPIGKKYYSYCTHCKQTLAQRQMPNEYRNSLTEIAQRAKTPIWHFIGLFLISIPILFAIVSSILKK